MTEREERTAYGRPHLLYALERRRLRRALRRAAGGRGGEAREQRLGEPALALDVERRDRAVGAERADPRLLEPVTTASAGALRALGDRRRARRRR